MSDGPCAFMELGALLQTHVFVGSIQSLVVVRLRSPVPGPLGSAQGFLGLLDAPCSCVWSSVPLTGPWTGWQLTLCKKPKLELSIQFTKGYVIGHNDGSDYLSILA